MLFNTLLASAAVLGGLVSAQSPGTASVLNNCDYTVYLANTPSADGVHQTESKTLSPGDSYSQVYTELKNLMGWSLKVAQTDSFPSDATFQFEYTFLNDGTIWFDLSNVNNQLWNLPFDISSSDPSCDSTMRQVAYLFPTDNGAMETNCTQSADVTVALCNTASGSSSSSSSSWGSSSSSSTTPLSLPLTNLIPSLPFTSPVTSSPAETSTTETSTLAPTTSSSSSPAPPPPPPASPALPLQYNSVSNGPFIPGFTAAAVVHDHDSDSDNDAASPTTFTTSTLAPLIDTNGGVETVWITDIVTEHITLTTTTWPEETAIAKRHEHHAHVHGHAHAH